MWLSGVVCTAGFFSMSSGCMMSTSTLKAPLPMARMSSSTFSRSLWKVPVCSRPSMSTHSSSCAALVGAANGDLLDAQDFEGALACAHECTPDLIAASA
jgi:hypothetical protein